MNSKEFSNEISILKYRFKRNRALKNYPPGITVNIAFIEELVNQYEDLYYKNLTNISIIQTIRKENRILQEQIDNLKESDKDEEKDINDMCNNM